MKISVLQPDMKWQDKKANFTKIELLARSLYGNTDLVILPEMFSTGFSMEPAILCESIEGETLCWMRKISRQGNFGICGSYIVMENRDFYNRWVFVSPEDDIFYYDKRHLFNMGEEDRFYKQGKARLVFEFRGIRISPYICYDLRFPVWSRNKGEYDLAIYSANWPEARINVWNTLLQARAIENQCYVAGSNRVGIDGNGIRYNGNSCIVNPRGEVIFKAGSDKECSITAEISKTELNEFRNKFNVYRDADDFQISL